MLNTRFTSIALSLIISIMLIGAFVLPVSAEPSPKINYQGKLTLPTGEAVQDGDYYMRFYLYDAVGGATTTAIWTEEDTGSNAIPVVNGLFSVMLGSTTPLTSVDFNQTLYLGVEIGGTSLSQEWDGEMSPRKELGTIPSAFEAYKVGGVSSSSLLRSDQADTMSANTVSTLLTLIQSGIGDILNIFDGATEVFTILDGGNVGIGTSSPYAKLTVAGDVGITGGIYDNNYTRGTSGQILQTTGTGVTWLSTSSLNVALSDTTGTLGVTRGGTGITSISTGGLLYGNGANSIAALGVGTTGQILQIAGGVPTWAATSSLGINTDDTVITVAANDTPATEKAAADYVADGTNDQDTIETALASLPTGGGTVQLLSGTFSINNEINITQASTSLIGTGPSTLLKITATSTDWNMVDVNATHHVVLKNFAIDGRAAQAGNQNAIEFNNVSSSTIDGIEINNMRTNDGMRLITVSYTKIANNVVRESGIYLESDSNYNVITGNIISGSASMGIGIAQDVSHNVISNNHLQNNWGGVDLWDAQNNSVTGNTIIGSTDYGILVGGSAAYGNTVTGNTISDVSKYGIYLYSSAKRTTVTANNLNGNGGGTMASIYLTNTDANIISNNNIYATGTAALIQIFDSTSERNLIANNIYENADTNTYVADAGTGTRYDDYNRNTLTTEDTVGYNLLSITGSTTATSAAITQLGTGDIFTLNNAASRVLTVINSGNVGIGTSSPSSKLSVDGDFALGETATSSASQRVGTLVWNGSDIYAKTGTATTSEDGWFDVVDNDIDVFLIAGQSNAVGSGFTGALPPTPEVGTVKQFYSGSLSNVDITVGSSAGSAWPSFGTTYYNGTGRKVLFVPAANSGTCQSQECATANSQGTLNWDGSGTLYGTSTELLDAALVAAENAGYNPVFKGILWMQGESDANTINTLDTTIDIYKSAFQEMITRYRTEYGSSSPFYIFRIGTQTIANDDGFAQVREAQEQVADEDLYTSVVWRGAVDFPKRNYMSPDGFFVHFTRDGYNEMGRLGAQSIISGSTGINHWYSHATSSDIYISLSNMIIGATTSSTAILEVNDNNALTVLGGTVIGFGTSYSAPSNGLLVGGNVGIGTTSPNAKLTVAGFINVDDTTSKLGGLKLNGMPLATGSTTLNNFYFANASSSTFTSGATYNYAIGYNALTNLTSGDNNFAAGEGALAGAFADMTGIQNNAIGFRALFNNSYGSYNNALGSQALNANVGGVGNNAIGVNPLFFNTFGSHNNALGTDVLRVNTVGSYNNAFGYQAADANTTGSYNNAFGYDALGSNNGTGTIAIGYRTADNATGVDRGIFLGYDIDAFNTTEDDVLNIGNLIFGNNVDGTGTTYSTGNIGIGTSSPYAKFSVAGNIALTGGIYDNNYTRGTVGQILQTTGSGVNWVSTSTLGIYSNPFGASIDPTELTAADFGSFTCNGTTCSVDTSAITSAMVLDDTLDYTDILYSNTLASNPAFGANETYFGSTGILFEGSVADAFEGLLTASITGADKTWTLPNTTGTIALTSSAMTGTFDGNNFTAIATGDVLYGSAAGTVSNLSAVATGNVLISGGVSTAPAWGKVGLATHVSGTLGATNGGTGLNTTSVSQLLIGGAGNTWTQIATSSLGIKNNDTVITVAANDSPTNEKNNADYIASGADDEVTIQTALDALPAGGGTVQLLSGTFNVGTTSFNTSIIYIDKSGVTLKGQGYGTVLKVQDNTDGSNDVITITVPSDYVTVEAMTIDGNRANNTVGDDRVGIRSQGTYADIQRVNLKNHKSYGIVSSGSDTQIKSCIFEDSATGIALLGPYNIVSNNYISGMGTSGLLFYLSSYSLIENNFISNVNGVAANVLFSNNNNFASNIFLNNGGGSNPALAFTSATNNQIIDNKISATGTSKLISIASGADNNILAGNSYVNPNSTDYVSDLAAGTKYNENERRTITTTGTKAYNLLSITGSTTATATAITQLGTGDIFTLSGPSSRALTVTNSGNIGIGTASPLAKLSVVSSLGQTNDIFSVASSTISSTSSQGYAKGLYSSIDYLGKTNITGKVLNPTSAGNWDPNDTNVMQGARAIAVSGSYAYVVGETSDNLAIVDISDPTNPTTVGNWDPNNTSVIDSPYGVAVSGQYAYVTGFLSDNLAIVDISDPTNPTTVGNWDPNDTGVIEEPYSVAIAGQYAYVTGFLSDNLAIVDISDPTNPTTVGNWDPNIANVMEGAQAVAVASHYAYVTGYTSNNLAIVDISDPTNPTTVGNWDPNNAYFMDQTQTVAVAGRYAYVAGRASDNFVIVDISDPTSPVRVGDWKPEDTNIADGVRSVSVAGRYAYVTSLISNNLTTVDISDPTDPITIGNWSPADTNEMAGARASVAAGNYIYIAGDVSDTLSVVDIGSLDVANIYAGGIDVGNLSVQQEALFGQSVKIKDSLNVGQNALVSGALTVRGNSSTTLVETYTAFNVQTGNSIFGGNVGIGTTSPATLLHIENTGLDGDGGAGIFQNLTTTNSVDAATQFGSILKLLMSNTATTTLLANFVNVIDDTAFSNSVFGVSVSTVDGSNVKGQNVAISGSAKTFGIQGVTSGAAGELTEPAGGFFQTLGTTAGNAIRGHSSTITTAALLSLFQDTSAFSGTGLKMNFGNSGGSFTATTSKYLDFQNAGTSVFTVSAYGTTTIGVVGATTNLAGLIIGYGGICVDDDGTCTASTSGRITSVESQVGHSDLAEMYFSSTDLEPGEIVTLSGGLSIDRADKKSTTTIIGVVSTNPGLTLGFDDVSLVEGETGYPVALSGRVPIKLSTENGPIKKGDALMLSNLPGIAMKATGTGMMIGTALEDFDDTRMYSETYINQFGDSLVEPVYDPVFVDTDPRINDGCYYGSGFNADGSKCVPLTATTSAGQIDEVNGILESESIEEQLQELREERSVAKILTDGTEVKVGQIIMFVQLSNRWIDESQLASLGILFGTSSIEQVGDNEEETIFDRLVKLANSFIDGVLSIFEIRVDRIEVKDELCVDGVCINANDLRNMLDSQASNSQGQTYGTDTNTPDEVPDEPVDDTSGTSTDDSTEPDVVPEVIVDDTSGTSTDDSAEPYEEPVLEDPVVYGVELPSVLEDEPDPVVESEPVSNVTEQPSA